LAPGLVRSLSHLLFNCTDQPTTLLQSHFIAPSRPSSTQMPPKDSEVASTSTSVRMKGSTSKQRHTYNTCSSVARRARQRRAWIGICPLRRCRRGRGLGFSGRIEAEGGRMGGWVDGWMLRCVSVCGATMIMGLCLIRSCICLCLWVTRAQAASPHRDEAIRHSSVTTHRASSAQYHCSSPSSSFSSRSSCPIRCTDDQRFSMC
jgi:hypothetical protein